MKWDTEPSSPTESHSCWVLKSGSEAKHPGTINPCWYSAMLVTCCWMEWDWSKFRYQWWESGEIVTNFTGHLFYIYRCCIWDRYQTAKKLPWWLSHKKSACSAGDMGSVPGLGRSPGKGNGNPLQYSCLEIPWTEKPDRLESMELQRVRHGLVTKERVS